jgi:hypothetical protein
MQPTQGIVSYSVRGTTDRSHFGENFSSRRVRSPEGSKPLSLGYRIQTKSTDLLADECHIVLCKIFHFDGSAQFLFAGTRTETQRRLVSGYVQCFRNPRLEVPKLNLMNSVQKRLHLFSEFVNDSSEFSR